MTRIDRYLLICFFRTLLICFCSLGGIFVVIHAFNNLDDLVAIGRAQGKPLAAVAQYYGPYLLALFDWTVDILAVMAILFTIVHIRRSGELTAILAAGIGHARIVRSLLIAAAVMILLSAINREILLPHYRDWLATKPQDLISPTEKAMHPALDRETGILIGGKGLVLAKHEIANPAFFLQNEIGSFGTQITAESAKWLPAAKGRPSGYLLKNVRLPEGIDTLPAGKLGEQLVIFTMQETPNIGAGNCFVVSRVPYELLQASSTTRGYLNWWELLQRVQNPATHVPDDLRVTLHSRLIRPLVDFSIVLISVAMVISAGERNLFAVAGSAAMMLLFAQIVKTGAVAAGSSGYFFSPAMAAWVPLFVFAPLGYANWRSAALQ